MHTCFDMNSFHLCPPHPPSKNRRKTEGVLELLGQDHVVEGVADVHLTDVNGQGDPITCINFNRA